MTTKREHISYSELKDWAHCPHYHKKSWIEKVAPFEGNEYTAFGSAIHDVCEKKLLKEDINENKTELMVKLVIMAGIYEFMFMHKTPVKVIINEYLKVSDFFVENRQKSFLNAILDKISKINRVSDE